MNDFSCRWAVATKTMIHSGFQPVLYCILRKCSSEASSFWRNCPETPDPIIWNTYYLHRKPWQIFFFFKIRHLTLLHRKKSCFSTFYSVLEIPRENMRIRQLYVTELVSSFHPVAPFFFPLKSLNLLSQWQDKNPFQTWGMLEVILTYLLNFAKHLKIFSRFPFCVTTFLGYGWGWFNLQC